MRFAGPEGAAEEDLRKIRKLVGDITPEEMRHVDGYAASRAGIFLPLAGQCGYAVKREHTHPAYSFVLMTGSPVTIHSGKGPASFGRLNTLVAMSPGFPHHEEETDSFVRYYAVFVAKDLFEETYRLYRSDGIPFFSNTEIPLTIDLLPGIKSFMAEYRDKLPGYREQLVFLEERLTHLIIRNLLDIPTSDPVVSGRIEVDRALEFIGAKFMEKLTLPRIARHAHCSPSHFSRLFRQEVGMTLPAYINTVRLQAARKKMEAGAENLTDIAFSCGYATASHFSTAFRKFYKLKPSEYLSVMGKKAKI